MYLNPQKLNLTFWFKKETSKVINKRAGNGHCQDYSGPEISNQKIKMRVKENKLD